MKKFLLLAYFLIGIPALAQTTAVTGTVTDPDGFAWAGGTGNFQLYNPNGGTVKQNGVPLTAAQMNVAVTLNGSGAFSTGLADNTTLTPVGTQWAYQICPAASAPCQTFPRFTASGASLSLTTAITSQIQALRFPASYTSRGYGDIEIAPLPPPGGTYYNLQSSLIRFWNGTVWAAMGSGGGGGGALPNAPDNSVQVSKSGSTAFGSDPNINIDTTTHTFSNTFNTILNAFSLTARNTYDPMDTKFNGGLAAAIAGTSGFTPTQVIQAAIDYGECQLQTHAIATGGGINIPLPARGMNISQILLWGGTSIGGDQNGIYATATSFQHIDATKPMIMSHGSSDTLVCNGTTYTPGGVGGVFIHNMGISGMGNTSAGSQDIGIMLNGQASAVWQVWGAGNQFGAQAILNSGFNNFIFFAGYFGAQISGCASFTTGALPVSSSITPNECAAVQDSSTDSELHYIYASDGAAQLSGNGPGACYPGCAAVATGNNTDASHIFAQVSDVDLSVGGNNSRLTSIRLDGTSRESVLLSGPGNIIDGIQMNGSCLSTALKANYDANIPTGCRNLNDTGQGNQVLGIEGNVGVSFFGQGYNQCIIGSNLNGASAIGGTYGFLDYRGLPDSTSVNDRAYCGAFQGDAAGGRVMFPQGAAVTATTGTINASAVSYVNIQTTTPVTHITGGINGQELDIIGTPGASIVPGVVGTESIYTCNGLPEVLDGYKIIKFKNAGGYTAGTSTLNNSWREICNTPNLTPLQVGFANETAPTTPSVISFFGNIQPYQIPNPTLDVSQLHGPSAGSGQYCFVEKANFSDSYYVTSQLACTSVDLAHQTAGQIFVSLVPQAITYDMYLVSNTTGSGIPLGKLGPPNTGGPFGYYWDGPTTVAAGGDGTISPQVLLNYTGMYLAPFGVLINTYGKIQPPCDLVTRGKLWLVDGGGVNPDIYQGCFQTGSSSYAWTSISISSIATTGFVPLTLGPASFGNSHINESSNPGNATFTEGIIVNDTSGAGGNAIGTEGSQPLGCVSGVDCLWADSTQHQWLMTNNGAANAAVVSIPVATPITAGHCVMGGTTNDTIVDAGAACGSGGGTTPGTPTVIADSGAGTGATTTLSNASDFSGFVNLTTGTCTGGVCPNAPAPVGVFTLTYSRTYTPALKCFIEPANNLAVNLANSVQIYAILSQQTTAHFVAVANTTTGLPQSSAFIYYYHCDFQ